MLLPRFIIALVTLLQGLHSAHWSASLDHVIYACEGDTVSLPWRYALDTGDTVIEVEWYYNGASQEIIAIESHGGFLPFPAFGIRVEQVDNAGLQLIHVTIGDSGNYTVVINGYDSSETHFELTQSVIVQINDQLMTQDGSVHVTVNPEAVLDTTADQWAIQLQCGHFTFVGNPPYSVEWTTPQGETRTSTNFTNGHFDLLLTNPVHGGNYTCRVPAQNLATSCLHGHGAGQGEASVFVDKVEARLTLLEKENQQLKIRAEAAEGNAQQMETRLQQYQQQTDQHQQQTDQHQQQTDQHFQQTDQHLLQTDGRVQQTEQRVEHLENMSAKRVSFHADHLAYGNPAPGHPLIVNTVRSNQGNAYNSSTGRFTTPYPGTYFFIATSGAAISNTYVHLYLYVDNTQIDSVRTYDAGGHLYFSSVHGVVHLNSGQTVWLRSGGNFYHSTYTTFTGFLISPDP